MHSESWGHAAGTIGHEEPDIPPGCSESDSEGGHEPPYQRVRVDRPPAAAGVPVEPPLNRVRSVLVAETLGGGAEPFGNHTPQPNLVGDWGAAEDTHLTPRQETSDLVASLPYHDAEGIHYDAHWTSTGNPEDSVCSGACCVPNCCRSHMEHRIDSKDSSSSGDCSCRRSSCSSSSGTSFTVDSSDSRVSLISACADRYDADGALTPTIDDRGFVVTPRFLAAEIVIARISRELARFVSDPGGKLTLLRGDSGNIKYDEDASLIRMGGEMVTRVLKGPRDLKWFARVWKVLEVSLRLLKRGQTCLSRDVYYCAPQLFRDSSGAASAVKSATLLIQCSRASLGIHGGSKGLYFGSLRLRERAVSSSSSSGHSPIWQEWIDGKAGAPRSINKHMIDPTNVDITSMARAIVVIEKECVLDKLVQDGICDEMELILVTGKGFPDEATRAFVWMLSTRLDVPVVGVCDCNPGGVGVLLAYKLGSMNMALDSYNYAVDLKWLGLRPSQVRSLDLPMSAIQDMTLRDRAALDRIRTGPFVSGTAHNGASWAAELDTMRELRGKFELEAVYSVGWDTLKNTVVSFTCRRACVCIPNTLVVVDAQAWLPEAGGLPVTSLKWNKEGISFTTRNENRTLQLPL